MKFGLTDEEFGFLTTHVLNPLRNIGCEVWIFGSRARGDFKKYSDVDLLISAPKETDIRRDLRKIKDGVEESNFPYSVDLVDLEAISENYLDQILLNRVKLS